MKRCISCLKNCRCDATTACDCAVIMLGCCAPLVVAIIGIERFQ